MVWLSISHAVHLSVDQGRSPHAALTGVAGFDLYAEEDGVVRYVNTFVPDYKMTDGFERVNDYVKSEKSRSVLHKIGEAIVSVVGFLVKAILIIVAICCTPLLFILLVVCFSLLMAAVGAIGSLPTFFYHAMPAVDWSVVTSSPVTSALLSVSGILVVGIPIVGFIHFLMSTFGGWKAMPFAVRMTLLILWLIALGVGMFFMFNFGMEAIYQTHYM